jgi:RNA polymerase sigma-70 factor (ECF subfamily)
MSVHHQPIAGIPGSTSSSLIAQVRAHGPDAWRRLARLYGPLVYRWARQRGLQDADAADIVQEVFRTVAARLADFGHNQPGATFRGWLWTVTYHKLGDHFRRVACQPEAAGGTDALRRLQDLPQAAEPSADGSAPDPDTALLRRAVELLRGEFEERTFQAFWRTAIEGQAAADVGRELEMTARAVRQARYRVLRRLREELGGLPG